MAKSTNHGGRSRATARAFLVVSLLLCVGPVSRSQESLVFRHLTVSQGLSQGSVVCILQDRQGFMWFGTQDGLNRFDGYGFTVFKHSPSDPASLNDNFVITIAEDSSGRLWVGTLNSPDTLNLFDPLTESFSQVPKDSVDLWRAHVGSAFLVYEDPSGVRWSGSRGGGLTRVDTRTGKTTVFKHDPADPGSLLDNRVYSVVGDRTGAIWVGTREGLEEFDPKTEKFIHYRHDAKDPRSPSDNWIWPILEDRSGTLWFGTFRAGVNRFDRRNRTFTRFKHNDADPKSLGDDQIYSLYQDRSGLIWVGTSNGVDRFDPEGGPFLHVRRDPRNPASLIDNTVLSLCLDRQGSVWVGTKAGLDRWDRAAGTFTHYRNDPANRWSLAENTVQVILEDKQGNLWIGTQSSGLDRLDRSTGRFTNFRHDPARRGTLSDNMIYALLEDRAGTIWVGTYGGGLNRFDRSTGTFTAYLHNDSVPSSLGARGIWSLFEDRDGVLWVGTYEGGLDRFDPVTGTFTHFRHEPSNPGSLSNGTVVCMYEDRSGSFWIGTRDGLNRFDRKTGTFRRYFEKEGLPNSYILGILEDEHANLWISTVKGISRFDPQRQIFRNYDLSDGLQSDEFNSGACARDPRTGELYFGGTNGFNVFHPDRVRDNPFVPPVVLSGFTRYNTDDAEGKPIVEKGISAKREITLSYKDNVASFEFSALSFHNTFKNQYAYRLEGYGEGWIQLGKDRQATFTNLDGGEYTLQVKGSNNDGVWNEAGTSLRIVVTPPWWKTRWAYVSYALLGFVGLYGMRRFELNRREQKTRVRESELRAKAVEAEKRALEAENERQTKELEDARLLQLSMLPREIPRVAGYDIAVHMKTATEVGGDYYDFHVSRDGAVDVAFGDATGHGMQAGTIVTLMKGLFLSDSSRFEIQPFFNHCSRAIKEIRLSRLFMAFTLVRLKGNSLSLSSAGMPPVYLYRSADGSVEEILLKGMPLGAMKNFPYSLHEAELQPGDLLLLLTDGLPEQKNREEEMFDYARVQQILRDSGAETPEGVVERLVHAGESWMDGAVQDDDITLMVIKRSA